MRVSGGSSLRWRRAALAGSLVLVAAGTAVAAAVGSGNFAALGEGKIALPGSGLDPVVIPANFRFAFDGAPTDTGGTGKVSCYDSMGQSVIGQFPYSWTTKRGSRFQLDLSNQDLADFLAAHIADATGGTAAMTIESASGKGVLRKQSATIPVRIKVRGMVSLDDSEPHPVKVKLKLR